MLHKNSISRNSFKHWISSSDVSLIALLQYPNHLHPINIFFLSILNDIYYVHVATVKLACSLIYTFYSHSSNDILLEIHC